MWFSLICCSVIQPLAPRLADWAAQSVTAHAVQRDVMLVCGRMAGVSPVGGMVNSRKSYDLDFSIKVIVVAYEIMSEHWLPVKIIS